MEFDADLIEHMSNPKNYGSIENADSIGIGENPQNGEKVIVYINVDNNKISNIAFEAIACMTTVVAGSIITQEARDITLEKCDELVAVTLGMLESVPPAEAACSEMVALAIKAAIDGYRDSKNSGEKKTYIYKIEQSCLPENEFKGANNETSAN